MVWLVGAFGAHTDVRRLLFAQLGELRTKLLEVKHGYLLIQLLWQGDDLLADGLRLFVQLDLSKCLVCKRR